jgi:hypothetical protein
MSNDKPKKDVLAELRSAIGQQIKPHAAPPSPPAAPAEKPVATPAAARKPAGRHRTTASAEPAAPTRSGRGVQFYLEDSDRKIINSLAVWFASQDRRLSDSQVIKTAIRLAAAQQNSRLLEIAETVRSGDRRRQPKGTAKKPPRRV